MHVNQTNNCSNLGDVKCFKAVVKARSLYNQMFDIFAAILNPVLLKSFVHAHSYQDNLQSLWIFIIETGC